MQIVESIRCEELRRVERVVGWQLDVDVCSLHEVVGIFSGLDGHHPDPHIALTIVPVLALFAEHEERAGARADEHWAEASDHHDADVVQVVVVRQVCSRRRISTAQIRRELRGALLH